MAQSFKIKAFLDDDGNPITPEEGKEEPQEEEGQPQEEGQEQPENDKPDDGGEPVEQPEEEPEEEPKEQPEEEPEEEEEEPGKEPDPIEEEDEPAPEPHEEQEVVDYAELPEAVQKFLDMYEDTGGAATMEDFLFINQDFSKLSQDEVIRRAIKQENPHLDDEDIAFEMEERFGFDPEMDDDRSIRKKKVDKKKFYGQALKSLQTQQEKYRADLGSRQTQLPPEVQEAVKFKEQFESERAKSNKDHAEVRKEFVKQTEKLLGKDFKGFEVEVGDQKLTYKPDDLRKLKEQNLDVNNFLDRFLDEKGRVKDVEGWHMAMAFASNPNAVAKHFYEMGRASKVEEEARDSKNYKSEPRKTQSAPKPRNKPKFRFLDDEDGSNKGKIKLRNY